jgi:hypothetical protein
MWDSGHGVQLEDEAVGKKKLKWVVYLTRPPWRRDAAVRGRT